jgi:hypothetical protein
MEGEWTFWAADGTVDEDRSGRYVAGVKVGGIPIPEPESDR